MAKNILQKVTPNIFKNKYLDDIHNELNACRNALDVLKLTTPKSKDDITSLSLELSKAINLLPNNTKMSVDLFNYCQERIIKLSKNITNLNFEIYLVIEIIAELSKPKDPITEKMDDNLRLIGENSKLIVEFMEFTRHYDFLYKEYKKDEKELPNIIKLSDKYKDAIFELRMKFSSGDVRKDEVGKDLYEMQMELEQIEKTINQKKIKLFSSAKFPKTEELMKLLEEVPNFNNATADFVRVCHNIDFKRAINDVNGLDYALTTLKQNLKDFEVYKKEQELQAEAKAKEAPEYRITIPNKLMLDETNTVVFGVYDTRFTELVKTITAENEAEIIEQTNSSIDFSIETKVQLSAKEINVNLEETFTWTGGLTNAEFFVYVPKTYTKNSVQLVFDVFYKNEKAATIKCNAVIGSDKPIDKIEKKTYKKK